MSNEIGRLKRKLRVIRPLLQKDRIRLDEMKLDMQKKVDMLEQAKGKHASVSEQRDSLLASMQSRLVSDSDISVNDMSNNRHYLEEIEQALERAAADLEDRKLAVDRLRDDVLNQQLGIDKLERYRNRKDQSLFVEQEKDQMIKTDELWIQRTVAEKNYERD